MNSNVLEGYRCPECGQEDRFFITAPAVLEVTDDGIDLRLGQAYEWYDENHCECPDCSYSGEVKTFLQEADDE